MPSVSATPGRSRAPRPDRHPRRARAAPRRRSRRDAVAAHSSMPVVSTALSVHTEYTSRPPGRTASAAAASSTALERRELGELPGAQPPARLGPAPQHAEAGARRVEQHAVERAGARTAARRRRPRSARPPRSPSRPRGGRDHARPARDGGRAPTTMPVSPMRLGERGDLAAGRGADLEDALARSRVERRRDRLARLVLRRGAPVAHRGQRAEIAGAGHHERVGHQRAARDRRAGRAQLRLDRVDRRRGAGSPAASPRRGSFTASSTARASARPRSATSSVHDPVGHRRADRRSTAVSSPSGSGHGGPAADERAEPGVDEALGARRHRLHRGHGLADRRVGGDAAPELVRAEAQRGPDRRVEARRPCG